MGLKSLKDLHTATLHKTIDIYLPQRAPSEGRDADCTPRYNSRKGPKNTAITSSSTRGKPMIHDTYNTWGNQSRSHGLSGTTKNKMKMRTTTAIDRISDEKNTVSNDNNNKTAISSRHALLIEYHVLLLIVHNLSHRTTHFRCTQSAANF